MKLLPIVTALLLAAVIAAAYSGWTNPTHVLNLVAGLAFCQ
jgi:hypothetical protein